MKKCIYMYVYVQVCTHMYITKMPQEWRQLCNPDQQKILGVWEQDSFVIGTF